MKKITNKQEALEAVSQDGMKLEECSNELRNDKDIAIEAVRNREKAMMFVSEELKYDKEVIQSAFIRSTTLRSEIGIAFSFLPEEIQDNEEMALIAISIFDGAFQYFSDRLKNDENFLARVAAKNSGVLRYFDSKYLKDEDFINKVLDIHPSYRIINTKSFARYLDDTLLDNENMMKVILQKSGFENFQYISERLKESRDYILEIIPIAPKVYEFLNQYHDNEGITLVAVKEDGMNLRLASWRLREDKEVVLEAVKNNPHSIQFGSYELQNDEKLLSYVTKDNSYYFDLVDPRNGYSYDIPMLKRTDPAYFYRYVDYMKMKEQSPDTFEKMLRWD